MEGRDHCNKYNNIYIKDVGEYDRNRTVVVDTSLARNACHMNNVVLLSPFRGNENDTGLIRLKELLI